MHRRLTNHQARRTPIRDDRSLLLRPGEQLERQRRDQTRVGDDCSSDSRPGAGRSGRSIHRPEHKSRAAIAAL